MDPDFPDFPGYQPVFGIAGSEGSAGLKKSSSQIDLDEIFRHFIQGSDEITLDDDYDSDISAIEPTSIVTGIGDSDEKVDGSEEALLEGVIQSLSETPAGPGASADPPRWPSAPAGSGAHPQGQAQPVQQFQMQKGAQLSGKMPISAKNQLIIEENMRKFSQQQYGSPSILVNPQLQERNLNPHLGGINVKEEPQSQGELPTSVGSAGMGGLRAAAAGRGQVRGGEYSRPLMPMMRDASHRPPRTISARVGFIKEDPQPMRVRSPHGKRVKAEVSVVSDDEGGDEHAGQDPDANKIQRRERNREHAKRSRLRKKFLLDALQQSVFALESENKKLKEEIVKELGQEGRACLQRLPAAVTAPQALTSPDNLFSQHPPKILDNPDYTLVKALQTAQQNFVITDPLLPDNPIVFASSGFLSLTGYTLDQVLGRNCRFLQGPETDPRAIEKIRQAVYSGYDSSVCLLNYRRDGSSFWNQFFIAALRDGEGQIVNYVGVQCKVSEVYAQEVIESQYSDDEAPPMPKIS